MRSLQLSPSLCLYHLTSILFTLTLPPPPNSSWLSHCLAIPLPFCLFYFITHSPLLYPCLSRSLPSSTSPWFCWGWVEVISCCITLAMCRQWMGLWQRLDSLRPQWKRSAREGNNYTYTWEDLRLFTKWKKSDSGYFIYCFIFPLLDWWPSQWMWTRCLWFGWTRLAFWTACEAATTGSVTGKDSLPKWLNAEIDCRDKSVLLSSAC